MAIAIWFWVIFVLALFFGMWTGYTAGQPYPFKGWGVLLVIFVLIGLLGWKVFGGPIQ